MLANPIDNVLAALNSKTAVNLSKVKTDREPTITDLAERQSGSRDD